MNHARTLKGTAFLAPKLKTLAEKINADGRFSAEIIPGYCNTDRKIPGTRLRHPGKGRWGNRIIVKDKLRGLVVLDHNAADTYRYNGEVVEWMRRNRIKL